LAQVNQESLGEAVERPEGHTGRLWFR